MTLEEAKSLQAKLQKENSDLEGKVKKYELLREAAREAGTHVSDSSHLEQEVWKTGACIIRKGGKEGGGTSTVRWSSLLIVQSEPLLMMYLWLTSLVSSVQ